MNKNAFIIAVKGIRVSSSREASLPAGMEAAQAFIDTCISELEKEQQKLLLLSIAPGGVMIAVFEEQFLVTAQLLNALFRSRLGYQSDLRFSCAIAMGEVTLIEESSWLPKNFVGPPTVAAARLLKHAATNEILVAESARPCLPARWFNAVSELRQFKGKHDGETYAAYIFF